MSEPYKRKPNIECVICKKSIYRRPSEIKSNDGKVFCSSTCYGISSRKESPCLVCGKPIMSRFNKKTCNRKCANIQRSGIKYKTGSLKDKVKSQKYLKIRLLEDRGLKCERCGYNKYEILQIHHKDRSRDNNDMENLELICPNCHYEEHLLEKSWLRKRLEKKPKNS